MRPLRPRDMLPLPVRPVNATEKAVARLANMLRSDLASRREHPSYGVTKAQLREALAHLEGALYAHGVSIEAERGSTLMAMRSAARDLGLDLDALRAEVRAA